VIAVGGVSKKEYLDKSLSKALEDIMQGRSLYRYSGKESDGKIYPTDDEGNVFVSCAMPIISEGDVIGCAVSLCEEGKKRENAEAEVETKLITAAASFLGKQMES
jgi:AbrB family transcriptional regulator (stage V sporulation protein T)